MYTNVHVVCTYGAKNCAKKPKLLMGSVEGSLITFSGIQGKSKESNLM